MMASPVFEAMLETDMTESATKQVSVQVGTKEDRPRSAHAQATIGLTGQHSRLYKARSGPDFMQQYMNTSISCPKLTVTHIHGLS